MQQATAIDISADQMQYLYAAIQLPDDRKNIVYKKTQNGKVIEKKTFSECRALHAGRYSSPATDEKAYSNYVATCRCLYNCAYLLEYEGYSKDQLKTYINNHYDSNLQDSQDIKDAKKDLRIAVNVAYDNTFQLKDSTGTLTLANKRKLLFLAFALHTANVRAAGYTPSQWIKSTVTKCGMDTAWERLSHW